MASGSTSSFWKAIMDGSGCNVCGDPFGIEVNSDLSLMDPWKIRQENALGETLVVVNTLAGLNLLEHTPHLVLEEKSYKEIEVSLDLRDIERKRQLVPFLGVNTVVLKSNLQVEWNDYREVIYKVWLQYFLVYPF